MRCAYAGSSISEKTVVDANSCRSCRACLKNLPTHSSSDIIMAQSNVGPILDEHGRGADGDGDGGRGDDGWREHLVRVHPTPTTPTSVRAEWRVIGGLDEGPANPNIPSGVD